LVSVRAKFEEIVVGRTPGEEGVVRSIREPSPHLRKTIGVRLAPHEGVNQKTKVLLPHLGAP